jgi:DNA-binding transcriptional ArsR family regulator
MEIEEIPFLLYQQFARVGQALASPQRVRILNLLCQSDFSVDELAAELGQSAANTSAHLKVLRESHLIEIRRAGRNAYCSLASDTVARMWVTLRDFVLAEVPEARELMREFSTADLAPERVLGEEAMELVQSGKAMLLDIRSAREYQAGHLPLAHSLPYEELPSRLEELPKDKVIIVYRRSPFCLGSIKAVQLLDKAGFATLRLGEEVAEWKAAGKKLSK